ncbi:MAG: hypothetical protein QOG09_742, partial [Solirubrobacterales bacterium]|nr:hypothetical protein [Solirubrobacterales bacterium]
MVMVMITGGLEIRVIKIEPDAIVPE